MKQLLFILAIIISFVFYSFKEKGNVHSGRYFRDTIPIVPRSNASLYTQDSRSYPKLNQNIPVYLDTLYADTAHVNNIVSNALQIGNDYIGALIYTSSDNNLWIRKINGSVKYWAVVGGGGQSVILPSCGVGNNGNTPTGFVTYDSTGSGGAVFDVQGGPYALCCDHQARVLNDTVIVIPTPVDTVNPTFISIYLGANGISLVKGVPDPNPETPQSPDSCALFLTHILFNANQTQPAFVNSNNPLIIYDEFTQYEWDSLFRHNVAVDSLNTSFPIHLLNASLVNGYTIGDNYFEFYTDSTINLLDYGALKFYVRPNDASTLRLNITWYLDDVPQTNIVQQTIPAGSGVYHTIVMSTANWNVVGTSSLVNKIRITVQAGGAAGFYLDWMQLQMGIPPPSAPTGTVTTFNAGNLNPLFITQVTQPTTSPSLSFIQQAAPAYTVLGNETNALGAYSFGKVDLAHTVTGLLPIINLAPSSSDGDFVSTVGGVSSWVTVPPDTILAGNWLRLKPDGNGNDSLFLGDRQKDSANLRFNTYVNTNNFFFSIQNDDDSDWFKIDPVNFHSIVGSYDIPNTSRSILENVSDANNGNVYFNLDAETGGFNVNIKGDAFDDFIFYTAGQHVFYGGSVAMLPPSISTSLPTQSLIIGPTIAGTIQNGFGAFVSFQFNDANGGNAEAAQIFGVWQNATTDIGRLDFKLNANAGIVFSMSGDGSFQLTPITATAASAIATAEGLIVFVSSTNGTFTSIGLWSYQNGAWHAL